MENNQNNQNNYYSDPENNTNDTANTGNANEENGTAGQQESGSTYSYSYLNQEQKNPNNVWRADENMAGAYTNAQQSSYNPYTNTQANTDGTYGSAQTGTNGAYGGQTNANGAYNAYGNGQTGYDYSNIYGSSDNQQAGWNTYGDAKAQKKEERAKKRAERKANGSANSNFGIKLAKCASIALVFGLVAGTAFEGSSYLAGSLLGTNKNEANVSVDDSADQKTPALEGSTKQTVSVTASQTGTNGVSAIVKECMPSIVAITTLSQKQLQNWFGQIQSYEEPSAGSGILISEDQDSLYIATNNHVIQGATTLTIRFCDNTTASAEVKGTDPSVDLAVVQVKKEDVKAETLEAIKVATLGDSEKVEVGYQAIAIGNALGYGQSVTVGYISALEREVTTQDESTGKSYSNNLIQTDAAINPGNSGGALLNSNGEVIGINSAKYNDTSVEGMGFAIPSNTAKLVFEDLINKKEVSEDKAAYLGIRPEDVTAMVAEAYNMPLGVFVKEVIKGTAADQYGVQAGDIITKIDGRDIQSSEALLQRLSYYEAGTQVEVVVQRPSQTGYSEVTLSVVLGKKES